MLKIYKRTIRFGQTGTDQRLESSIHSDEVTSNGSKSSNWMTLPAMLAGAVTGIVVFSVFFAALLIPFGLLGLGAWWRLRKRKEQPADQTIDAEYTVITDTEKKNP